MPSIHKYVQTSHISSMSGDEWTNQVLRVRLFCMRWKLFWSKKGVIEDAQFQNRHIISSKDTPEENACTYFWSLVAGQCGRKMPQGWLIMIPRAPNNNFETYCTGQNSQDATPLRMNVVCTRRCHYQLKKSMFLQLVMRRLRMLKKSQHSQDDAIDDNINKK